MTAAPPPPSPRTQVIKCAKPERTRTSPTSKSSTQLRAARDWTGSHLACPQEKWLGGICKAHSVASVLACHPVPPGVLSHDSFRQQSRRLSRFWGPLCEEVNPKYMLVLGTVPQEEIQKGKKELRHLVGKALPFLSARRGSAPKRLSTSHSQAPREQTQEGYPQTLCVYVNRQRLDGATLSRMPLQPTATLAFATIPGLSSQQVHPTWLAHPQSLHA